MRDREVFAQTDRLAIRSLGVGQLAGLDLGIADISIHSRVASAECERGGDKGQSVARLAGAPEHQGRRELEVEPEVARLVLLGRPEHVGGLFQCTLLAQPGRERNQGRRPLPCSIALPRPVSRSADLSPGASAARTRLVSEPGWPSAASAMASRRTRAALSVVLCAQSSSAATNALSHLAIA